ncbi:MAG: ACT domain-containing protein [Actinobacteria bacterium]|nr:ACT domain-containing protein [Thermoleophilia bacterium]MCB9011145.1 ACT domain-containing protein [Actinomycetota bacterium]
MTEFAVTAVGSDRPGIVAALTGALLEVGGNLADCRAALLRGSFAVAMLVDVADDVTRAQLAALLEPVAAEMGLGLWVGEASPPDHASSWGPRCVVSVYGIDRPGIVHAVSAALADHGANVIDLQSRAAGQPPIYALAVEVDLPPGGTIAALQAALASAAETSHVEVSVQPVDDEAL